MEEIETCLNDGSGSDLDIQLSSIRDHYDGIVVVGDDGNHVQEGPSSSHKELSLSSSKDPNESMTVSKPKSEGKTNAKANTNNANTSLLNNTMATEQSSFDVSMDKSASHYNTNTTINSNNSMSFASTSNDLFTDAFVGLGDLASGLFDPASNVSLFAGDLSFDDDLNPSAARDRDRESSLPMHLNPDINNANADMVEEEPGRIVTASSIGDAPFDEGPLDECAARSSSKKHHSGNVSAMARMRYQRKHGVATPVESSSTRNVDQRSSEQIQREKHEKWRQMKLKVQREEERYNRAVNEASANNEKSQSRRDRDRDRDGKEKENNSNEGSGFSLGMFGPLAEALHQSQTVLLDASNMILGTSKEDFDYYSSDESSGGSETSSYYAHEIDDDDDCSDDDTSKSSRSRRNTKRGNNSSGSRKYRRNRHGRDYNDDESDYMSEDSDESEFMPKRQGKGGSNKTFLEDITSDGIYLVHHIPRSKGVKMTQQDVCVNLQISDAKGGCIEPNFVWKVIQSSPSRRRRRRPIVKSKVKETISLFDVSSVQRAVGSLTLESYPYAVPEKSIIITLNNGNVQLFEAPDEAEARRVVHGLRWIEARFTFNMIVGNISVCSEMLSVSEQQGISELTSEIMLDVTNQLVEKSVEKLGT